MWCYKISVPILYLEYSRRVSRWVGKVAVLSRSRVRAAARFRVGNVGCSIEHIELDPVIRGVNSTALELHIINVKYFRHFKHNTNISSQAI
jgi:hypothetical protein